MNSEDTIKHLKAMIDYEYNDDMDAVELATKCIRKVNEVERWLDPDIDSEKALEKIREIIYG